MLKATVLGATLMLAQIACPLGGGGGTDMSEDPTPEQCDRQEGVCYNSCARRTTGAMEDPTSSAMQTCYAECMGEWGDNCATLDAFVDEANQF